ncbi:MAG: S1/P1 nuclease [Betaproteobacteria bacterium]|nr:S1/P1 nuclease [Betaproteobacteria bacterium]
MPFLPRLFAHAKLALFLCASLGAPPAHAWGDASHRIIATIAEHFLTPQAQRRIDQILADENEFGVSECPVKNLQDAASWADCVRPLKAYAYTYAWHFDDIPVCGKAEHETFCPAGNCLSAQTEIHIALLANPATERKTRLEALKFIVHFIGDIHQPLHTANNRDRGGNDVPTRFLGQTENGRQNLHRVWDARLLAEITADTADPSNVFLSTLDPASAKRWQGGTIQSWIDESHAIAVNIVYGKLPRPVACNDSYPEREILDAAYYAAARPIVQQQILKAGVRLAAILNQTLQ